MVHSSPKQIHLLAAAVLAVSASFPTSLVRADDVPGYTTISISGSTALKNFDINSGSTYLTPGQSFIYTPAGGSLTTLTAPNTSATKYQLAPAVYNPSPVINSTHADVLRIEYHEQGSVEGIQDLIASQIGSGVNWTATSANKIWVNTNAFTANGQTANGWTLSNQNAVQIAQSDVNATQGFAMAGTPAFNATPLSAGYGKGNPALGPSLVTNDILMNLTNTTGMRPALADQSTLNMPATKFGAGPWNTGGLDNVQSTKICVTATLFAANPGTGLTGINRTDAQWLETTSRMQNGAQFNFSTRDVNSGTRNMSSNNVGVDPSWAVGKNDAGNGFLSNATTTQISLNPKGVTFSNKTSGGAQLLPTLLVNRLSIGTIGLSDAIANVSPSGSGGANPLRALAYSDSTDGSSPYVQANISSITDGSYVIWQNENYVTLKNPAGFNAANGTWASQTDAQTGILGDTTGAVAAYRQNVLFGAFNEATTTGVNNPGDTLLSVSFIPEQYMAVTKPIDGVGNTSANPIYDSANRTNVVNTYGSNFQTTNNATTGLGSVYGKNGKSIYATPSQGDITITTTNYLFGNFNQNGTRDLSAVKSALAALKAYVAAGANTGNTTLSDYNSGIANNSSITYTDINGTSHTITKGDAIVMGDTLSRGSFDGKDLFNLAHGAALSDASGSGFANGALTAASGATLGDQIRNGTLRKNAALDYLQANTTAGDAIRVSASQNTANDPTGLNAFNKLDVNHDGLVNRTDALTVDTLLGKDFTNLNDQLGVSLKDSNGNQQSIVDAVLADGHSTVLRSDLDLVTGNLISNGALALGDANLDGKVDLTDLAAVLNAFGTTTSHWTAGNFDGAATIDSTDITDVLNNFGSNFVSPGSAASSSIVVTPEPASLSALALVGLLFLKRRR